MVESRKVLTVSYGTFSCTLEGYDSSMEDSVGMMKQIATYFRDLAAEDRQFGVTATQASEMFARHAEREIARRIEARNGTSDLVLSLGRSLDRFDAPLAGSMPFPTADTDDGPGAVVNPETPAASATAESFSTKLQRIRSVVVKGATPAVETALPPATADLEPAALQPEEAASATEPSSALTPALAEAPQAVPAETFAEVSVRHFAETLAEPLPRALAETLSDAPAEPLPDELAEPLTDPLAAAHEGPLTLHLSDALLAKAAEMPAEPVPVEIAELLAETLSDAPAEPLPLQLDDALLAEAAEMPAASLPEEIAELLPEPHPEAPAEPLTLHLSEAFLAGAAEVPTELLQAELSEPLPEPHVEADVEPLPLRLSKALLVKGADAPAEPLPEEPAEPQSEAQHEPLPLRLSKAHRVEVAELPAEPLPLRLTEAPLDPATLVPVEAVPEQPAPPLPSPLSDAQAEPKPDPLGKRLRKLFGRFAGPERPATLAPAPAEPVNESPEALAATQPQTVHGDSAHAPDRGPFLLTNVATIEEKGTSPDIWEKIVPHSADQTPKTDVMVPGEDLAADLAEADEADLAVFAADLADIDVAADPERPAEYPDYADLDEVELEAETLDPDEEAALLAELAEIESGSIAIAAEPQTPPFGAHDADDIAASERDSAPETETVLQAAVETAEAGFPETDLDRGKPEGQVTTEKAAVFRVEGVSGDGDDALSAQEFRFEGEAAAETDGPIRQPTPLPQDLPEDRDDAASANFETMAQLDAAPETEEDELADQGEGAETSVSSFPEPGPLTSAPAAEPLRARFTRPEDDAAAIDRLLSQTDAHMSGPEAARRRDAIAQLRAAVAASEAARSLGQAQAAKQRTEDGFRGDLHQVVQPRRPTGVHPVQRGERPRPSPLRLVASQRIDAAAQAAPARQIAATQPIRPRRIKIDWSAARDAAASAFQDSVSERPDDDRFPGFAARMGASSLTDLIEAAAAHATYVEGIEDFSRPQILTKVAAITAEATQEEGLRAFGILLREGRILRSPRAGRFEVARDTRFHPERRAV